MPFGGRKDGRLVRDVPAYRRIMPHLMRGRNEAAVYFEQRIDAEPVLAFVERWNASGRPRITFFHVFMWALVEMFDEYPRVNRFTRGGRLYERDGIWVSFSAKKRMDDESPVVVIKRRVEPGRPFEELVETLAEDVRVGRSDEKSYVDKELGAVLKLPEPVLSLGVRLLMWLDVWNLLPHAYVKNDPMYATVFVANLGSLKLDAAYHHLYEYGTIPAFVTIGRAEKRPVVDSTGNVSARTEIALRWTFDERVEDGLYCAHALDSLARRLESLQGIASPREA